MSFEWPTLTPHYKPLAAEEGSSLPSIAALWGRAKEMLAQALERIEVDRLKRRTILQRRERSDFRNWMGPVFSLVHSCILARAIEWLIRTPEGRKLLRETPKTAAPEPAQKTANYSTTIPLPGWETLAKYQHVKAALAAPPQERELGPAAWRLHLGVIGAPNIIDVDEQAAAARARPLDTSRFIIRCRDAFEQPMPRPRRAEPMPIGLRLARMVEAVSRVLENPDAAIRRTARMLARMSRDALDDLHAALFSKRWKHGIPDSRQGGSKFLDLKSALLRVLDLAIPEPG